MALTILTTMTKNLPSAWDGVRARSLALLLAPGTLFPALLAAQAAPTPEEEEVETLEAFVSTGSNIARIEMEQSLPLTVFDSFDLELIDAPSPVDLIESLPYAGDTGIDETSALGADARGDAALVNLRSVNSGNTLILLNGRRLAPHPISAAEGGVPALQVSANILPNRGVRQVEILRDGASAIYGSDAAAGVINTIMRKEVTGWELVGRYDFAEQKGGDTWRTTLTGGMDLTKKTTLFLTLDYYKRQGIMRSDREQGSDTDARRLAPPPWDGSSTATANRDFDNSSVQSIYGNFQRGTLNTADNTFTGSRPTSNRGILTSGKGDEMRLTTAGLFYITPLDTVPLGFTTSLPDRNNIASAENEYYFNFNPYRTSAGPSQRVNAYASVVHEFDNKVEAFGDLFYYNALTDISREPVGLDSAADENIYVPASNYYNPFGTRFYHATGAPNADGTPRLVGTPGDVLVVNSRLLEFGPRMGTVRTQSFRAVAGLRGRMWGDWRWETAILMALGQTKDAEHNMIRESRVREALARSTPDALNPFHYTFALNSSSRLVINQPFVNPESVIAPLRDVFVREGETGIYSWDGKITGKVFELPAGAIQVAGGAEVRMETYMDYRPPYAGMNPPEAVASNPNLRLGDNDFLATSPNINLDEDRTIYAAYAEFSAPIFGGDLRAPLLYSLELNGAVRFEDYSDFGNTTKPKVGLAWHPVKWIMLRANYGESFRAPNLAQTFEGSLQRAVSNVGDDYRQNLTPTVPDAVRTRKVFRIGNQDLQPEESDLTTVGMVIQVPGVKNLTVGADWWKFNLNGVIDNLSADGALAEDERILREASAAAVAGGTAIGSVNMGSGTANYLGSNLVVRQAPSADDIAAFAAYNAANPTEPLGTVGQVDFIYDTYLNLAGRDIEGVDGFLEYQFPTFDWGKLSFKTEATYMIKYDELVAPGEPLDDDLWEDGKPYWKGNARLLFSRGDWTAGFYARYVGTYQDTAAVTTTTDREALGNPDYITDNNRYIVKEWWTYNLNFGYRFRDTGEDLFDNVRIRVAINNLLDEDPPLVDSSIGYDSGTHSAIGRVYSFQVEKDF